MPRTSWRFLGWSEAHPLAERTIHCEETVERAARRPRKRPLLGINHSARPIRLYSRAGTRKGRAPAWVASPSIPVLIVLLSGVRFPVALRIITLRVGRPIPVAALATRPLAGLVFLAGLTGAFALVLLELVLSLLARSAVRILIGLLLITHCCLPRNAGAKVSATNVRQQTLSQSNARLKRCVGSPVFAGEEPLPRRRACINRAACCSFQRLSHEVRF